jgi:hypothetical protein
MSLHASDEPFFIGWSGKLPGSLGRFYLVVGLLFVSLFALLGLALGSQVDNPAQNLFVGHSSSPQAKPLGWQGDQHFEGALTMRPYPLLHVAPSDGSGAQRTLLLSGYGKRGPEIVGSPTRVSAMGGLLKRGDIDMLVMDDPPTELAREIKAPVAQPMGHWKAVGEICDGKCYPGGMTPGGGLSHRACAVVCLIGEIPAIFVVAEPVAGSSFLLLAGPDGGAMPNELRPYAAKPLELEGEVERLGSILIFRVDPRKARLL